ncbi:MULTISPECIES: hypothetical protein [unclassified Streptomyces]|uniref:hypothetical protein n=1 Tax=unclassified Streptomyces TaxID=2593676 RepID=UPI003809BE91
MKKISIATGGVLAARRAMALALGRGPFAPGTVTAGELAGAWAGAHGESLEFREDGAFCADGFPVERSPEQRVDTCGRWNFSDDRGRDQGIDLDFDEPSHSMIGTLRVSGPEGRGGL